MVIWTRVGKNIEIETIGGHIEQEPSLKAEDLDKVQDITIVLYSVFWYKETSFRRQPRWLYLVAGTSSGLYSGLTLQHRHGVRNSSKIQGLMISFMHTLSMI